MPSISEMKIILLATENLMETVMSRVTSLVQICVFCQIKHFVARISLVYFIPLHFLFSTIMF